MVKLVRRFWRTGALIAIAAATMVTAQSRSGALPAYSRLLVGLNAIDRAADIQPELTRSNAVVVDQVDDLNLLVVDAPENVQAKLSRQLQAHEAVRYVEQNSRRYRPAGIPTDPLYSDRQQWNIDKIDAPRAWDLLPTGGSTIVAVLDTGIDFNHPEFVGRISPAACSAFYHQCPRTTGGPPQDKHSHGTHVAGIIGANTNNGVGISSVTAGRVTLLPVQVLSTSGGSVEEWTIAGAIVYAARNGARVVNLSLGDECEEAFWGQPMEDAIRFAEASDVLLVWAAGNEGGCWTGNWPASDPRVLSVAATDIADVGATFTDRGAWVGVAAPGVGILSTVPLARGSYATFSGTSMAAPHVAGAAALLFQVPGATKAKVVNWLMSTCDPALVSVQCGGRINLYRAMSLALTGIDPARAMGPAAP